MVGGLVCVRVCVCVWVGGSQPGRSPVSLVSSTPQRIARRGSPLLHAWCSLRLLFSVSVTHARTRVRGTHTHLYAETGSRHRKKKKSTRVSEMDASFESTQHLHKATHLKPRSNWRRTLEISQTHDHEVKKNPISLRAEVSASSLWICCRFQWGVFA